MTKLACSAAARPSDPRSPPAAGDASEPAGNRAASIGQSTAAPARSAWTAAQMALFDHLDALGIAHRTVRHPAVFTVAEALAMRQSIVGAHTKNLFLKDKKGCFFLVVLEEMAEVDLKSVHHRIGGRGRVSFGKAEELMALLGVAPGSVTLFAAIHDTDHRVRVVMDADLLKADVINAHPLSNDATTSLTRTDMLRFLESVAHAPLVVELSGP